MANWFDDPKQNEEVTPQAKETPVTPEVPQTPEVPAQPPAPEVPQQPVVAPQPVVPLQPPVQPQQQQPQQCGWYAAGSTPPSAPRSYMPQPPNYNPQTPSQQTGGYRPYTPPPAPKKKRGMGIVIAILASVCAVSLLASVVLAVSSYGEWPQNPPFSDDGGNNGGTGDGGNNGDNSADIGGNGAGEDAPTVNIIDPEEEGLTSKEIVQKNLASVVTLRIFTKNTGFFGGEGALTESGVGSGIVWTADGYIITNAHCVINEETGHNFPRLDIELSDGTRYESVTVIGADTTTDLAVLKIPEETLKGAKLTPAEFGNSDQLSMGDKVIAIGNPGGLGLTATQGIVSGMNRDVYEDTGYAIPCIQIDAAINPGNSGGPLFNSVGQVVGINSSKIVATGYEGLGFSIPINEAKKILDELVKDGHVSGRVALGITGQTVSTTGIQGFYIATFEEGSCMKNSGAQVGDIIIYLNQTRVIDYSSLRAALAQHDVGDTVSLTLLRYNESTRMFTQHKVQVTLGESTP